MSSMFVNCMMHKFLFVFSILTLGYSISIGQPIPNNPLLWVNADTGVTISNRLISTWEDRFSHHLADINLASVSWGSYIVNILSAKGRRTGKIVIEH
jgi:hypothetical protein